MADRQVFHAWISAARLRTLPLSISGILVGSAYAYYDINRTYKAFASVLSDASDTSTITFYNFLIPILALITTLGFQVLSNFANDYGDGVKGTDNEDRIGPMRAIQSGLISPQQMKVAMTITALVTLASAVTLIYVSLGWEQLLISLLFLSLGIAAIWAAIKYTVGDNAYGYRGLGDVFVFIFFGPVSVEGIYFLITKSWNWQMLLPSICIGLLSVAVLNLNNMRDAESDKKAGKNTLVVKMGWSKAKLFHYTLITGAFVSSSLFYITVWYRGYLNLSTPDANLLIFLPVLAFIPLFLHLLRVQKTQVPALLDPELKKVALSTFLFALLAIISTWVLST
ncbi:1,4-dihydroxy-2-naphthoate octaprenyltransferase [Nonlabens xiamenensis]|uniref:1,4-dihydroxy-2-naphthoate octaprenyltransferase n=1 Tax=Nonlabens xiamenensis TaxID=2341043 RepID=UPI000F608370|nr:1,4-dihydroxy-2-naphthoate octaprenyltransferase [Nonlabens xiamenensis]